MLGPPSALVGVAPDHERVTSDETPGTAAFADRHALLVASGASSDNLNERIASRGGEPVPTVDQGTGAKAGPEPIRTLATYRRHPTAAWCSA